MALGPTVSSDLLHRAQLIADQLRLDAAAVEVEAITRSRLDEVVKAGLVAAGAPEEFGGHDASPAQTRAITELIAGACGTTWFVLTQHRSALDAVLTTQNRFLQSKWRDDICSGRALGAVAFAHLRRSGPPQVIAQPQGDGWKISGHLDWVTGWGVTDALALMAQTTDNKIVEVLIPAQARPGLVASAPLPLMVMGGTRTVSVELEEVHIAADEVAHVKTAEQWHADDTNRTVNTSPAVFGLLDAVIAELATLGSTKGMSHVSELALAFEQKLTTLRSRAYYLVDNVPAELEHDERLAVRAKSLLLAHEATAAFVASTGGGAIALSNPAQRWAREALFFLVQAQTSPLRTELMRSWPSS
ncbi:unannotated protein [freshwater metagenome]|uniref:Unannotated protein n=1 Tax=freshwater metagenome TaxID=449393 RepID=A0A6J7ECQ9_9ZZZZ